MENSPEVIGPSSPKQELMLMQQADTAILGGAMGSGKSYIALLYPLKFAHDPYLRGVIFRKTTGEITAQGGLWENACDIYSKIFGRENIKIHIKDLKITFPSGGSIKFSFLESSKDLLKHQGAQYTFVLFDEATHFTLEMIEYLRKRMRSAKATHQQQMVLTCNPDPDWELLEWIKPYLTDDGTPDRSKDGKMRYYVVDNGEYIWSNSKKKLSKEYGEGADSGIRNFTFISANCMDNIPLMKADPHYLSNLKAQPWVDVQRYLYGNWYVRPSNSTMLRREWLIEKDQEPSHNEILKTVRAYDFAFVQKSDKNRNPDYTVSVKMSRLKDGNYFIHDVRRIRILPGDWMKFITEAALEDGPRVDIILPLDPQTRYSNEYISKELSSRGLYVRQFQTNNKKLDRFKPFASICQNGGMQILRNCGTDYENDIKNDNNFIYKEWEAYEGERSSGDRHDDICDASADAFAAASSFINIPNFTHGLKQMDLSSNNPFVTGT